MQLPLYYLGWIAFAISAFSVAGNDAIQTIGTFLESKKEISWLLKTLIFGLILVLVHMYGWSRDNGQIHFHRLDSFEETQDFNIIQLLAPVILVIITRMKAPVSTTFLILGLFGGKNIEKMLIKSFVGYALAFTSALVLFGIFCMFQKHEYEEGFTPDPESEKRWSVMQWISTCFLWITWLLQDTANIAVFLPRKMNPIELFLALGILVFALGIIMKSNGGRIQEIVSEKSDINTAKAATIVDLIYGVILLLFQVWSKMPMSTTWVFLGLLAGREIILHLITKRDTPYLDTFKKVSKDVFLAALGIIISISIYVLSEKLFPKPQKPALLHLEMQVEKSA